jgi:NADPH:quinone reductase-like Zn-dependent oxidoreductase
VARKGQYPDAPPFPFVPGYEVSGQIVEVGSSVGDLAGVFNILLFS